MDLGTCWGSGPQTCIGRRRRWLGAPPVGTGRSPQGPQQTHTMTVLPAGGSAAQRVTGNLVYMAPPRTRVGAGVEVLSGLAARATVVATAEAVEAAMECGVLRASGLRAQLRKARSRKGQRRKAQSRRAQSWRAQSRRAQSWTAQSRRVQ